MRVRHSGVLSAHSSSLLLQFARSSRSATRCRPPAATVVRSVSIHALLAERDRLRFERPVPAQRFNSRAPRGARRRGVSYSLSQKRFQFTRSSRSATQRARVETDIAAGFNSRAPRGARPGGWSSVTGLPSFQFTRSSRSATCCAAASSANPNSFNSRAPRGARPSLLPDDPSAGCFNSRAPRRARRYKHHRAGDLLPVSIHALASVPSSGCTEVSIHALLAERDAIRRRTSPARRRFQFTRSSRSATGVKQRVFVFDHGFNSRAPRGARRPGIRLSQPLWTFQFTRSSRSATDLVTRFDTDSLSFNSRAPRGARPIGRADGLFDDEFQFTRSSRSATSPLMPNASDASEFQFTRSSRSATDVRYESGQWTCVSIHALLAERDQELLSQRAGRMVSIHALLAERDRRPARNRRLPVFQFTRSSRSATNC